MLNGDRRAKQIRYRSANYKTENGVARRASLDDDGHAQSDMMHDPTTICPQAARQNATYAPRAAGTLLAERIFERGMAIRSDRFLFEGNGFRCRSTSLKS